MFQCPISIDLKAAFDDPRKGPWLYVMITVLLLASIPVGLLITLFGFEYGFPTPGMYAAVKLVPASASDWGGLGSLDSRAVVGATVDSICCYMIIGALTSVVVRLWRKAKSP